MKTLMIWGQFFQREDFRSRTGKMNVIIEFRLFELV